VGFRVDFGTSRIGGWMYCSRSPVLFGHDQLLNKQGFDEVVLLSRFHVASVEGTFLFDSNRHVIAQAKTPYAQRMSYPHKGTLAYSITS